MLLQIGAAISGNLEMKLLLKNLLFTILVPGTVAGFIPISLVNTNQIEFHWFTPFGYALIISGVSIYIWCVWNFAKHGKGTPLPLDAPKRLVISGLYHYVRNPMYIGVLSVILGWAFLFNSKNILLYWLCVAVVFHLVVTLYEEPRLLQLFGSEYQSYRKKVNRWIPARKRKE